MRSLIGDVLSADPENRNVIKSFLRWALLNDAKGLAFVPWIAIKASESARLSAFTSEKASPPDPSGVDDGRYDYGLSQPVHDVKFEGKIMIPMRDGTKLIGDVFRPDAPGRFPVIMGMAPYPRYLDVQPGIEDAGGVGTKYQQFEQPNPEYWIPRGYAYVSFNSRGFCGSEGEPAILDRQEAEDFYDAIEWAAEQPWSTGDVGLSGISYYAFSQYWVAGLQQPHLKAIVPWAGLAEPYRDCAYRGGVPSAFPNQFLIMLQAQANRLLSNRNYLKEFVSHPLNDDYWTQYTNPSLAEIEASMLSACDLNDAGLHLRGNVNAFVAAKSPQKKLLLTSGTHWGSAYQPWANRTVLRFFDHWLKGKDAGVESEPAIDVHLRTGSNTFTHVYGNSWPLEQTEWTKYYLNAGGRALNEEDSSEESSATAEFKADEAGKSDRVTFLTEPLEEDVAIAGPLAAHLWVSSSGRDVDICLDLRDFDENGEETRFSYVIDYKRDDPVARGWLRASHRALDPERSRHYQPYHLHTRNDWLTPGVPVELDVEIWPTSMVFKAGHRIGLTVHCGPYKSRGNAGMILNDKLPFLRKIRVPMFRSVSPSSGTTKIHTGGKYSSWLELPVIPADPAPRHEIAIDDGKFSPGEVKGQMGDRFEWTNRGEDYHSVTESSGLGLWDSQLVRGSRSHNPETWWTKIPWAGTFNYRDMVCGLQGAVAIPAGVSRSSDGKEVAVELGLELPPDGTGFDVQLQADDGKWKTIHEGVPDVRISIDSLSPGSYKVRSRLRRLDTPDTAGESGWAPPAPFDVK